MPAHGLGVGVRRGRGSRPAPGGAARPRLAVPMGSGGPRRDRGSGRSQPHRRWSRRGQLYGYGGPLAVRTWRLAPKGTLGENVLTLTVSTPVGTLSGRQTTAIRPWRSVNGPMRLALTAPRAWRSARSDSAPSGSTAIS